MKKLLLALLLYSAASSAQVTNAPALINQRGATLPTNCSIGQLFFKTDATAGQNIYNCTSANTWTQQAGGGSGTINAGTIGQFAYYAANGTTLSGIDVPSLTGTPAARCQSVWTGTTTQALVCTTVTGTVLIDNGSTFVPSSTLGTLVLGASGTLGSVTMGNATSGTVTLKPVTGTLGTTDMLVPAAVGTGRLSQVIAAGTSALGTSEITSGNCASVVTTAATGTATTDTIDYAFNADLSAVTGYSGVGTLLTIYKYPSANNVNWKVCNWTGASITPSAATINWSVRR